MSKKSDRIVLYPVGDASSATYEGDPRAYTCCNVSKVCTRWTVGILALVSVILIVPVAILAYLNTADTVAIQRNNIQATSETVGGSITGLLQFDTGGRDIDWWFYMQNTSTIVQMGIYGPITYAPGTLFVPLCGLPTSVVCTANGTVAQLLPQGYSLVPYINQIRAFNMWYYVNATDALGNYYIGFLGVNAGAP